MNLSIANAAWLCLCFCLKHLFRLVMKGRLSENVSTEELRLLIGLSTLSTPFLLNEAFEKLNYDNRTKYNFYILFFGLLMTGLVYVENLPPHMVKGATNIMYRHTTRGKDIIALYKQLHPEFFSGERK